MQVLGSASGTWGGDTWVDLLDVEGRTLCSPQRNEMLQATFTDGKCGRVELSEGN